MMMKRKIISFFSLFQVIEHRWNEIDRGKPKYSGKNLSQCHFVHRKSHMDRPGIELGASNYNMRSDFDKILTNYHEGRRWRQLVSPEHWCHLRNYTASPSERPWFCSPSDT
jgi:hypothetical protein